MNNVNYKKVNKPTLDCTMKPVLLSDETMEERYDKVISKMNENSLDALVIYADLEHGNNFEYLTGFLPRFEEAILVVHSNRKNYMLMGNENLNKVSAARIKATAIHVPHFSLPNQPMDTSKTFTELLESAEIAGKNVGVVGWKMFTSTLEDNSQMYDVPSFVIDSVKQLAKSTVNACNLFIGQNGVRTINNVNEIEHYEFGASLAGDAMLEAMDIIDVGTTELEIGSKLNKVGQKNSVVTIAASGKRFIKANIYPTDNEVKLNDPMSLTVGYKGGLSSRSGIAVHNENELTDNIKDYLNVVVKPYFNAYATWMEKIHVGMVGGELYNTIEEILPKAKYGWSLCPGHLTSDEEWMSSPIYNGSQEILKSGMMLQIDIIPSVKGYPGTSAESSVVLCDSNLRKQIETEAPELFQRMMNRRKYIEQELGIKLSEDLMPMCSTVAYLRPFLLNKDYAMTR